MFPKEKETPRRVLEAFRDIGVPYDKLRQIYELLRYITADISE